MDLGKVKMFNDIMGEGVIEPEDNSEKIFVSYREIQKKGYKILDEGQRVKYEVIKTPKGKKYAKNVKSAEIMAYR
jgi:CspA family cold shock protein